jgi:hypothetical protein
MEIIFRCCEMEASLSYVERWAPKKEILRKCWLSLQKSVLPTDHIVIMHDKVSQDTLNFLHETAKIEPDYIEIGEHTWDYNLHTVTLFDYLEGEIYDRPDELFYILEDDYLHVPDALHYLKALYKDGWKTFALTYDYPDRYQQLEPRYVLLLGNHHWATVTSSCTTFAVTGQALQGKPIEIFKKAAHQSDDRLYPEIYKEQGCLAPIPGLSSHLTKHHNTPIVDWQKVWDEL